MKAFVENPESNELTKNRIKAMVIGLVSMQSLIKQLESVPQRSLGHLVVHRTPAKEGQPGGAGAGRGAGGGARGGAGGGARGGAGVGAGEE